MQKLKLIGLKKDILKCKNVKKEKEPEDLKLVLRILLEKDELFSIEELKYAFNNMEGYYQYDRYYEWNSISCVYRLNRNMKKMKNNHIERRAI